MGSRRSFQLGTVVALVALLTHNLATSFPQHYDYVIGEEPGAGGLGGGRSGSKQDFKCPEMTAISECSCMDVSTDFEIQCPVTNPEITVKIKPSKYAQIQCYDRHDFGELPQLAIGDTEQVKIIHCPLPPNISIRQYITFLGVKHMKQFWYQNYGKDLNVRLVRQHFQGMQDLEKLSLSSGLEDIQPDLFADLSNLKWLTLRSNHLKLLHNVFDNLHNLTVLELGANQLSELEPGLLKNQRKLVLLNLWRNQLRNISKESFRGIESLQQLDLSVNFIESLNPDVFELLPNLVELNLGFNRFSSLPENLLSENRQLAEIKLFNNQGPMRTLPPNFLGKLAHLKKVYLNRCNFAELPPSLFHGSSEIVEIDLSYNQLGAVPELLLRDQLKLMYLNLAYNDLEVLPEMLLENTKQLVTLRLSYNRLRNLTANIFASLGQLTELHLGNNMLHTIHVSTFAQTTSLKRLDMQNNQLAFHDLSFVVSEQDIGEGDRTPFQYMESLQVLNLRNNSITTMFRDWNVLNLKLRELDLSYNNISSLSYAQFDFLSEEIKVNLSYNRISEIDLSSMEAIIGTSYTSGNIPKIYVDVSHNPLDCSCNFFHFAQYLQKEMNETVYRRIEIDTKNLQCAEPRDLQGTSVTQIKSEDVLCLLDHPGTSIRRCPAGCSCSTRRKDFAVIVNGTGLGLTQIPELPQPQSFGYRFIELHLDHNNISELPTDALPGYSSVAELYLANNAISEIYPENLPASLRLLDLTHNKLTSLNESVVKAMNNSKLLTNLKLSGNQWRCDCSTSEMLRFVRNSFRKVSDISQLTCDDGSTVESIQIGDLCNENISTYVTLSIILSILGLLIGLLTVLFYTYNMEIKVWMFTHNVFVWLVTEEELDKDKMYDAFISYSHKDEDFITDHLIPTLEKEPMNFKTCWHVRDFMPGELIPTQIVKSVEESRRTIVVLSNNFLQSEWAKMEFRTAHLNSMSEKRVRVIIIIYGDIGDIENLDSELKAYLKMNTYVKWGDPWFWDKLRYAMPHPPTVKGLKRTGLIKNHIRSSVDDKLELIKPVPVTPPPLTTPPAELNGSLSPAPFIISNGKTLMNGNGYHHGNGHLLNGNGHINGAYIINSNAKQSDV